jgi:hypothetical protein
VMEIRIVPYSPTEAAGAQAFNERLYAKGEVEFLLPRQAPEAEAEDALIRNSHFLALEGDVVRGGFMLARFPAILAGQPVEIINCREPLSEGIVDPKYSLLALRLLKDIQQRGPYMFALGMGSEQARFTRLLKAAGWTIEPVPFLFRVTRVSRFLSELRTLQNSSVRRLLGRIARLSGAGKIGVSALQAKSMGAAFRLRGATIERITEWGSWTDALWEDFRRSCSFCVKRDRATLAELYRIGKDRSQVFLIRRDDKPIGWVAALNSQMNQHKYFGNMQVATILDCIAYPGAMEAALALATRALRADGADLIVTNQSYRPWLKAFRSAGFLSSGSNYFLATSKPLTQAIASQPGGRERMHFTRGDSDGRIHL